MESDFVIRDWKENNKQSRMLRVWLGSTSLDMQEDSHITNTQVFRLSVLMYFCTRLNAPITFAYEWYSQHKMVLEHCEVVWNYGMTPAKHKCFACQNLYIFVPDSMPQLTLHMNTIINMKWPWSTLVMQLELNLIHCDYQCSNYAKINGCPMDNLVTNYNFWLSVQVISCPYFYIHVQRWVLATDWWLSVGQLHQYLLLSGDFFGCPGRTDNQNFEHWWLSSIENFQLYMLSSVVSYSYYALFSR